MKQLASYALWASLTLGLALAINLLAVGTAAAGPTAAEKCSAAKIKEAGKYGFCRLKAESKAIKKGEAPDYSKCDSKFPQQWMKAETKAGGECPTSGDEAAIQAQVTAHTDALVQLLAPPTSECDALVQDCPEPGEACYVSNQGDPIVTSCANEVFPGAVQGAACGFINGCAEGYSCILTDNDPNNPTGLECAFHCNALAGSPTCDDGPGPAFDCRAINDFYGNVSTAPANLGMCVDPLEWP